MNEYAELLIAHNEWRREKSDAMPKVLRDGYAKDLGIAINAGIDALINAELLSEKLETAHRAAVIMAGELAVAHRASVRMAGEVQRFRKAMGAVSGFSHVS